MRLFPLTLMILACAMLSGCVYEKNDRLTIGGTYRSPTLFDPVSIKGITNGDPTLFRGIGRDRASWSPTPFVAHFDGVVHGHMLRVFPATRPEAPARAYGRYPTISDALDPQSIGYTPDLWYTIREYGRSSIGSDYSFLYLLTRGELFEDMMSPFPYKRTQDSGWSSGQPATEPLEESDE